MKLRYLLFLLMTTLFLLACSQKKVIQPVEVKKYIADLKAMKYDELKQQLTEDTALLNKLIKTATLEVEMTSHFSSGEKSAVSQSVPEFKLNINKEKVAALFNDYARQLYFDQNFSDNNANNEGFNPFGQDKFEFKSRFSLTDNNHIIEEKDSLFKPFENNVSTEEQAYFFRGKKIPKANIGLKRIDSIETEVSLKFATDFEQFAIEKSEKQVAYNEYTIQVESIKENVAKLKIPIALYNDIIAYQATNSKNLRMNSSALSSMPMLTINKAITNNLLQLRTIFTEILKESDEKKGKEELNQIKQHHLDAKENLAEFVAYFTKLSEDKEKIKKLGHIGLYNEIAEAGQKVIMPQVQFVIIEFPDDIKNIDVFVGTMPIYLKQKKMAKFGNHYSDVKFFDVNNSNIIYSTKKDSLKFGVSNRDGQTIIDAKYDELKQLGNEYFLADKNLYWLDVADKKMVSLPQYKNYIKTLKTGFDVFEKTIGGEDKLGLVQNREKIILPFNYYQFEKYEHFIIASKPDLDEVYDLNFKKLPDKGIQKINTVDKFISTDIKFPTIFVGENVDKKKALVDKNLNLLTPFKYESIDPFFAINNYYIAVTRTADGSDYMYGIIDMTGKEVVPFIFCSIIEEFDKNGKLKFCLKDKNQTMDFKSFLQKHKK